MDNLIKPSEIPSPQSLQDAAQMITQVYDYLKDYFHYLNTDERQHMRKMGNRRLAYATNAMVCGKIHSEALPRSFDPNDFESLINFHNQLGDVYRTLQQLNEGIEDTLTAIGVDAMSHTKLVHDSLRGQAKSGKYDDALNKLDSFNAKTYKKEVPDTDPAKEQKVSE